MPGDAETRRRRRRKVVLLWMVVALLLAGQTAVATLEVRKHERGQRSQADSDLQLEKARRLLAAGKWQAAGYHLDGILSMAPDHDEAKSLRGWIRDGKPAPPPSPALSPDAGTDAPGKTAAADGSPRAADHGSGPDAAAPRARASNRKAARKPRSSTKKRARPRRPRQAREPREKPKTSNDVKVARGKLGDSTRGARTFRMGCGLCHGRSARRISPGMYSPRRWKKYFALGSHGTHTRWRSNFTRSDLADVKAYLISNAR